PYLTSWFNTAKRKACQGSRANWEGLRSRGLAPLTDGREPNLYCAHLREVLLQVRGLGLERADDVDGRAAVLAGGAREVGRFHGGGEGDRAVDLFECAVVGVGEPIVTSLVGIEGALALHDHLVNGGEVPAAVGAEVLEHVHHRPRVIAQRLDGTHRIDL